MNGGKNLNDNDIDPEYTKNDSQKINYPNYMEF